MTLEEVRDKRSGLMSEFALGCDSCSESISFSTSLNAATQGRLQDINCCAVYHSVETGSGYEGLGSFCSIFNMPCMQPFRFLFEVMANKKLAMANTNLLY